MTLKTTYEANLGSGSFSASGGDGKPPEIISKTVFKRNVASGLLGAAGFGSRAYIFLSAKGSTTQGIPPPPH